MNSHSTRIFLVTVIVSLMVCASATADDSPYIDIPLDYLPIVEYHPTIVLGDPVIIANQQAYATPLLLCATPLFLDAPLGIYVNGVEAHVVISREDSIAEELGFVEIAIGGNGLDAGFSGFIQEKHLVSPGTEVPPLPTVTLSARGVEDIALHLDFGEDAPIIATYPSGTQAQLLGYLDDMCHVQIGDKSGFVKTSQLELPPAVTQGLNEAMPSQFDSTPAKEKYGSTILDYYEREKLAQYGPNHTWPLSVHAEQSALSIQLGGRSLFFGGVKIVPGPDELKEQEAMNIAAQTIYDSIGITQETLLQYTSGSQFYDSDYKRTGHYWWFDFWNAPDPDLPQRIELFISSPGERSWRFIGDNIHHLTEAIWAAPKQYETEDG